MWDTIVIGSGIAGLTAANALARHGQRVLVLEQHRVAGGLTQMFTRQRWRFATGVHYIGGVGPGTGPAGQFGRLLAWLSDGALAFADCGNPYDVVRLPGFEFAIEHPQASFRRSLIARFPDQAAAIDTWFLELDAARQAGMSLMAMRGMPPVLAWGLRLWRGSQVAQYTQRTLAQALSRIDDPRLRAVLGARWANYGSPPALAPLLEHAIVTGSYNDGSYYPVGGPARFAQTLSPAIEAAGGELRLGADVRRIQVEHGRVTAVVFEQDGREHTELTGHVISAMAVGSTVNCLDAAVAGHWRETVQALEPGLSHLALYLGFEGDIAAAGASGANIWIYESDDIGRVWHSPADEDAPGLFVSFPSLKDPANEGAPTAEVIALCDASTFEPWLDMPDDDRPEDYRAMKAWCEARLLNQFRHHFPALAPMLRFHELSTPLTQRRYVRTPDGSMYGIEMSSERLASPALTVRTPVAGLLLAGQDVTGAGIQAACMSGLMAAAAIEPALLRQLTA